MNRVQRGSPQPHIASEAPTRAEEGRPYVVKKGDTLWDIAQAAYGNPTLWPLIRDANPGLVTMTGRDIAVFYPGAVLQIPPSAGAPAPAQQARAPVEPVDTFEPSQATARPAAQAAPRVARSAPAASAAGPTDLQTAKQGLDALVQEVWADRHAVTSSDHVYKKYASSGVTGSSVPPEKCDAYLADLEQLAAGRPAEARSNIQGIALGNGNNTIGRTMDAVRAAKPSNAEEVKQLDAFNQQLHNTFFRFERAVAPEEIRERVYLHAAPEHATDVMKFVVKSVVDKPQDFPGVQLAKVSGPGSSGARSENIVIYTTDQQSAQKVVQAIREYQAQHPDHFEHSTQYMAEQVAPGVARGAEPLPEFNPNGKFSFGSLRAQAIYEALEETRVAGDEHAYRRSVDAKLRGHGVDPAHPDRNLSPGAA